MGCGTWDTDSFRSYSTSKGLTTDKLGFVTSSVSNQEMFKARDLDSALDPKDVIRECCDSDDHPNTLPVILALDVTGSMGQAAVEVAKKLNGIMTKLYENIKDVVTLLNDNINKLMSQDYKKQAENIKEFRELLYK